MKNVDQQTVDGFGREWEAFDQASLPTDERRRIFDDYFRIFPWETLAPAAVGADIGCGSGRWAAVVAPNVGFLHLVDASERALDVARQNLRANDNCAFSHASAADLPFEDESLDFAYSLGVLHHVPNTADAIASIGAKLKPGAPLLLYLYYAFDNRPSWFKALWAGTDLVRRAISPMPFPVRRAVCHAIAMAVYWPMARTARILDARGGVPSFWPLSYYRDKSFYVMRTDALDRFGTRLEPRFSRKQIEQMFGDAGFENVRFSPSAPYWCAVAVKR